MLLEQLTSLVSGDFFSHADFKNLKSLTETNKEYTQEEILLSKRVQKYLSIGIEGSDQDTAEIIGTIISCYIEKIENFYLKMKRSKQAELKTFTAPTFSIPGEGFKPINALMELSLKLRRLGVLPNPESF